MHHAIDQNMNICQKHVHQTENKNRGKARRMFQGRADLASSLVSFSAVVVLTGVQVELRPQ